MQQLPNLEQKRPVLILALFALALLPLFATPILPFIDYYNHIARYYVLAHPDATPAFAASYTPRWAILPNIGLDVIAAAAMRILPPAIVPHLIIITLFATLYSGVLALNRALTSRTSLLVAMFTIPLLYSFILNWGFANFLLGLGTMFWALAWWLNTRQNLKKALPFACLLAALIFFIHGLAFALYGLILGALELGLFLNQPDRRPLKFLKTLPPLAIQALLPVALFLAAPTSQSPEGLTNADEAIARLKAAGQLGTRLIDLAAYRLTTIIRVAEGPSLGFDILSGAAIVLIVILMVNRGLIRLHRPLWPAIFMAAVLVLFCPPTMFGVGYVADRMPLLLALLFIAGITARPAEDRFETTLITAATALIALRLAAIALSFAPYAQDEADFNRVASTLPPSQLVETLWPNQGRLDPGRRCQMFPPRLITNHHQITRLFANATQQPLQITGPLAAALNKATGRDYTSREHPDYHQNILKNALPAGFNALLICDPSRLTAPLPNTLKIAAASGRFMLLVPNK